MGAAWAWVIRAAIKIRNPQEALGEFVLMREKVFPMQYTHWVRVLHTSLMLGSRGIQVEAGCLLDLFFFPERNFFFFLWAGALQLVVVPFFIFGLGGSFEQLLTGLGGFVLLECGSLLCTPFFTGDLGTGVGWAAFVMLTSGLVAVCVELDSGLS